MVVLYYESMDTLLVIVSIVIGFILLYVLLRFERINQAVSESIRGQTGDVAKMLQMNTRQLNERLDTASQVIGDLKKNLGEMSEVGKGIRSLQEFLQSPKLRGNIGEQVLADMIGQTFPKKSFHLQYAFRSGAKVDAVLETDAGLLCIDSKFPMENFTLMHKGETEEVRNDAKKDFVRKKRFCQ
ncbi:MAG: hypothetical protein UU25_C0028G0010 [Microgenomates group bacterium GW2011_GWB1_40_9]|nr:MAG: hypothetical protein UU25_C0028G0010 [Microgenomates group bacterium GW2011_GWB1_40_9]